MTAIEATHEAASLSPSSTPSEMQCRRRAHDGLPEGAGVRDGVV